MSVELCFEDLSLGQQWRSRARTVTEADVVNFASITGDFDPLHVDHAYAAQTPFGKPIAHGLLGLALVAGLGSHFPQVRTIAFVSIENWEFLKPIFFGNTVHVVNEIVELEPQGRNRGRVAWRRQLINQDGQTVQEGRLVTLVLTRKAAERLQQKDE